MPERLQLSRVKGARLRDGAIKVDRTTAWGNPCKMPPIIAVEVFKGIAEERMQRDPQWLAPLRGKDLACWCKLDALCHADVLLDLANRPLKEQSGENE